MEDPSTNRPTRNLTSPEALIVLGGIASAAILYVFLERGGDVALAGLGMLVIVAGITAIRYPLLGLVAITVITVGNVSDNLINAFGAPSVAKLAGPGLAAILAVRYLYFNRRPFFDPQVIFLFSVFVSIVALSVLNAFYWSAALSDLIGFIKDLVIVLLTLAFFNIPNALRVFTWSLLLTIFFVGLVSLYQYSIGDFTNDYFGFARIVYSTNRLAGPIEDPNFFGAVLVFLLPLAAGKILFSNTKTVKALGILIFIVLSASLAMTASRGAILALFVSFSVYLFVLDRRSLLYVSSAAIVVITVAILLLSEEFLARFELVLSPLEIGAQQDSSIEGRLASWKVAIQLFIDYPVFGVGTGTFSYYYQDYALDQQLIFRGQGRSAHSLYLEVLSELGMVGFTGLSAIITAAFVGVFRACKRLKEAGAHRLSAEYSAFGIGLLGYLTAMTFLHDAYPRLLWSVFAVAIALPRIASAELDQIASKKPSQQAE